jgi:hypothetical protein
MRPLKQIRYCRCRKTRRCSNCDGVILRHERYYRQIKTDFGLCVLCYPSYLAGVRDHLPVYEA